MSFTDRFTGRAGAYAAGRPGYPAASIDVLFEGLGDPREVVAADLGAGTGISSRLLAERGATVLALEPNAAMREAAQPHARVQWLPGTAEATGLGEASIDLVTAFQAFHWFDHARALREMVRILRPGGRAAVVYNERDERDPFTAAYGELGAQYQTDETERRRADGLAAFAAFEVGTRRAASRCATSTPWTSKACWRACGAPRMCRKPARLPRRYTTRSVRWLRGVSMRAALSW